ncbi:hypothetical protein [Aureispira anguillae]|uniref:Lipoprotein n=1 Tax=Aureispira anguillae TaxID=2864201 RepID=A0A915YJP3_9BACT|nr:hypothetical protein [Aureispira anguillae]BDS14465.1 hypothetical protein AsAng_0052450 [Aureispira anguillae]
MKILRSNYLILLGTIIALMTSCGGESVPKDLALTKEVNFAKFDLKAKIPADWEVEEELNYEDQFKGYLIKGKRDRIRIEENVENNCFTESSVDEFAQFMTAQNSAINAKVIPEGKGRTPDKFTSKEVLKYKNGIYGVLYKNEFTTEVDGKDEFVEYEGLYVFNIKNKAGTCIQIENTHYNNKGETLPTDLKIIQSIH